MSDRRDDRYPPASIDAVRIREFLARAESAGLVDRATVVRLARALREPSMLRPQPARPDRLTGVPRPDHATPSAQIPAPARRPEPVEHRPSLEVAPPVAVAAPPPRLGRFRELVASDIALHGLAYLGVLLMFVGTFGFVVFAFGEVDPIFRPLAEAAIPFVCFAGAAFLHRQRAPHVAVALEVLGGLTLPVVAFASFVDDAGIPPDQGGDSIAVVLAVTAVVIGAGYAWWARQHPESPLRYLVAPMLWITVWAAGLVLGERIVEGTEIRRPNPGQMAWFTVAVTATVLAARALPGRWLSRETLAVAPFGLALGVLLGFSTAPEAGWPAWSILATGIAALVGVDLLAVGFTGGRRDAVRLLEASVVATTALMLVEPWGEAWPGVVAAVGAIALAERWRLDGVNEPSAMLVVLLGGVGLAASLVSAWPTVVAFGVAATWAHARRPEAPEFLSWGVGAMSVLLPLGVLGGLLAALDDDVALVVASAIVLIAAGLFRLRRERFDGAWAASAVGVLGACVIILAATQEITMELAVAAGVITVAAVVRPGPAATRLWTAWPGLVLAGVLWLDLARVAADTIVVLCSLAGLAAVLLARFVAADPGASLEALGHLTTGAALAVTIAGQNGPRVTCLAVWTAGWVWSAVAADAERDPLVTLLERPTTGEGPEVTWPLWFPAWIVAVSVPILVVDAGSSAGWWATPASQGVAIACLASLEAASTWTLRGRPIPGRVAADASILTLLVSWVVVAPTRGPAVIVGLATVAAVVVTAREFRRPAAAWLAWLATAPVALRLADLWAGVSEDDLYGPLFIWGAVLAMGALAIDDARAGRRELGALVRTRGLEPPAALGVLGTIVALVWVATTQPADVWAPWFLAGSAFALMLTVQTKAGAISAVAWGLAVAAGSQLARDLLLDEPWVAVATAVVPAAVGVAAWAWRERPLWARWDVPALVAAHVLVAWALIQAFPADRVAATWLGAAALSFLLAVGVRSPAWAVGGGLLAIVGAEALGAWWLALALTLEAAATWLVAARSDGRIRLGLQATGTVLSAAAWAATVVATGWSDATELRATAIVAGVVALVAGVATRARIATPDWLVPAGVLAAVGWSRAGAVLHLQGATAEDHLVLAASASAIAVAAALAAAPARVAELRDAAAVLALVAAAEVALSFDPSPVVGTALLVGASVVSLLAALASWRSRHLAWVRPLIVAGSLAGLAAVPVAAIAWPTRAPLVAALSALGAEAAAAGMLLRRPTVFGAAPVLMCAAWLVFATAAFTGEPMWFTVPVGIAALFVLETVRWDRRLRHEAVKTTELVAAELVAIALVVGAAPLQIVTGHLWAGLTGAALGVGIATWGVETHVRRRVWAGVVATAGCLLMLALVPLVKVLPNVEQATLWVIVGGLGILVIVIATAIERGRPKLRAAMHHLHEMMGGWE